MKSSFSLRNKRCTFKSRWVSQWASQARTFLTTKTVFFFDHPQQTVQFIYLFQLVWSNLFSIFQSALHIQDTQEVARCTTPCSGRCIGHIWQITYIQRCKFPFMPKKLRTHSSQEELGVLHRRALLKTSLSIYLDRCPRRSLETSMSCLSRIDT